jgi:hypothetical protein|tara:strand:- start:602 stop:745 length:144 start_codon:yes stop_codon:yes gene_type:complete
MNGLEMLYHMLFVEYDKGLWGIIALGVIFTIISIVMDYGYSETRDKH